MNTTRTTPIYYRVTGLWGALEGSLLLWEWILIIFSALVAWQYRHRHRELLPWVLFVFSTVLAFFLAVMAFASNPFEREPRRPEPDEGGLGPGGPEAGPAPAAGSGLPPRRCPSGEL